MRIECVIVSVEYSDFLAESLPLNLPLLDDLIVVTAPEDHATIRLCKRWSVRYLATHAFWRDGSRFNKALGINHGLNHLDRGDWLLHLDADIVLPSRFRHMLNNADLDPLNIYGIDRVNCPDWQAWAASKANPQIQYEWEYLITPQPEWPLGSRVAHTDYGGWCPIGFFQLWNVASGVIRYQTVRKGTAESSDLLHATQWDRNRRVLLPEIIAIHLESGPTPMGANWHGRATPTFGPPGTPSPTMAAAPRMPAITTYEGRG